MAHSMADVARGKALLICPTPVLQAGLCRIVEAHGLSPVVAESLEHGEMLTASRGPFSLTVVDVGAGDDDGLEGLRRSRQRHEEPGPVVALAQHDDLAWSSKTEFLGAEQVVLAPWGLANVQAAIVKVVLGRPRPLAGDRAGYDETGVCLQQEVALWRSAKMRDLWSVVQQAAGVDITVLIGGETGTGKDLVARAIHHLSPRRDRPFVKVNCAAVPAELLESELFGHERGAFTGAHQQRVGKFEAADRGVVFLDEIGDLHLSLQAKLLHVLQDGAFCRVGGRSSLKVDVRIVAATNRDLEIDVAEGRFREDLYYRLNVVQVIVPPLRERAAEIPLLADYFVRRDARLFGRDGFAVSPGAMERLMRHQYPGNVRELENIVKRMVVLNDPLLERVPIGSRKVPAEVPSIGPLPVADHAAPPHRLSLKEIPRANDPLLERVPIGSRKVPAETPPAERVSLKEIARANDPLLERVPIGSRKVPAETPSTGPVPVADHASPPYRVSLKEIARTAARAAEREAIARVLKETRWNRVRAAKLLGISYRALLYKIKDVGLASERAPGRVVARQEVS